MLEALPYSAIVVADFEFEFGGRDGNLPRPVCMVAKELRSGREWRVWRGEFDSAPPFPTGADTLFVAYRGQRRAGLLPRSGLADAGADPRSLCRVSRSNQWLRGGRGLIDAMNYFGLDAMGVIHKKQMVI